MKDMYKTKAQLIEELAQSRKKIAKLEAVQTEYQQVLKDLRKSEKKNQALLNALPDLIYRFNEDGTIVDFKGREEHILPVPPHEVIGKNVYHLRSEELAHRFEHYVNRALQTGKAQIFEYQREFDDEINYREARIVISDEDELLMVVRDISKRKRAEEKLRQSERRYRLISELTSDYAYEFLIKLDQSVFFQWVTESFCRVFGYSLAEIAEIDDWYSLVHPDDHPILEERLAKLLQGESCISEYRMLTQAGEVRWLLDHSRPVWDESSGRVVRVYGASQDITTRKKVERTLQESEDKLRTIFSESPIGICIYGKDGSLINANLSALEIFGIGTIEGIQETNLFRKNPWFPSEKYQVKLFQEDVVKFETEIDFDRIRAMAVYQPTREGKGCLDLVITSLTTGGYLVQVQDITERKQAAESLRQSETLLRSVVDNVVDGIITVDGRGQIESFNPAAEKIFGYSAEEAIGQNINILMPKPQQSKHKQYIENYLRTGEAKIIGFGREVIGQRKDGSTFPLDLAVSEFQLGEKQMFIGIVRDITERKQLEEQFRQSQKMEAIGRLAGGVAHDFNNILTIITGHSEFLLDRHPTPGDPQHEDIQQIKRASERARMLTRQLLAFSRRQPLRPQKLDLNEVVANLEKMLRRLIGEDIEFVTRLRAKPNQVEIDPGQLEQVLMNLVVNARDAMPYGGRLTIETDQIELDNSYIDHHFEAQPGSYVLLIVADTGAGMNEKTQSRIFEPFFTTKEAGRGTGLGLATVHGIIRQSNGYIWVYSEQGLGTTFKIYLPCLSSEGEMRTVTKSRWTRSLQGSETILLVEDEASVRQVARKFLEIQGYTVLEAPHGDEAIHIFQKDEEKIDLLVTDVIMPGMSGRKLSETLSELQPRLKTLYISGYADDTLSQHGVLSPDIVFLEKPFSSESLARKVREVLDNTQESS